MNMTYLKYGRRNKDKRYRWLLEYCVYLKKHQNFKNIIENTSNNMQKTAK